MIIISDTGDTDECHFPPSQKDEWPEDSCSRSFSSSGALDQHLLLGNCNYKLEKMCLKDQAKSKCGERIHTLCATNRHLNVESQTESAFQETYLTKGWSLKGKKEKKIFLRQTEKSHDITVRVWEKDRELNRPIRCC